MQVTDRNGVTITLPKRILDHLDQAAIDLSALRRAFAEIDAAAPINSRLTRGDGSFSDLRPTICQVDGAFYLGLSFTEAKRRARH